MWSARFPVWVCAALVCGIPAVCGAQPRSEVYVGSVIGVATLSADARSVISDSEVAVSLYEPHNGVAANVLLGAHVHDYVTIQGNYIWNRNDLMLLSTQTIGDGRSFSQEFRASSQHMVVGDLLVYFRPRGDRVRPYLSGGGWGRAIQERTRCGPAPVGRHRPAWSRTDRRPRDAPRCGWIGRENR